MSVQVKPPPADLSVLVATVVRTDTAADSGQSDEAADFTVFDIEPINCTREEFLKRLRSMDQGIAEQKDGTLAVTDSAWFRIEDGEIISIAFPDYLEALLDRMANQAHEELARMAEAAQALLDELSREAP